MDAYGENSKRFHTHTVMSHFLVWKEHYKPKINYLTLDFCVLTFAIRFRLRIVVYDFRKLLIILVLLLPKSSVECSPNQSLNLAM